MPYNRIVSGGISQQNCSTPVVEMLSKVQVNRGSLLKSVENLLKTIETSESAVMIPTLLKDKVRVDAWELLFVAKILKASILGHSDLVEFYMNHIGHSSLAAAVNNQTISATSPSTPTINGIIDSPSIQPQPLSPMVRQSSHSPAQQQSPIGSPSSAPMNDHANGSSNNSQQQTTKSPTSASLLSTSSSLSSNNSTGTLSTQTNPQSSSCSYQSATNGYSGTQRSATGGSITPSGKQSTSSVSSMSTSSSSTSNLGSDHSNDGQQSPTGAPKEISAEVMQQNQEIMAAATSSLLAATRPLLRQAQPPSLLQLTTTNNHINSVAAGGFSNTAIEQLTNQLSAMQAQQQASTNDGYPLSISTSTLTNGTQQSNGSANLQTPQTPQPPITTNNGIESRINRSAGCLFRANSGASSPRTSAQTPTTPYPQAETLSNGQSNGLMHDPSAPVKLLLQIEQLKSSISHVTNLIDSVVDLYKKSIDNIAQ